MGNICIWIYRGAIQHRKVTDMMTPVSGFFITKQEGYEMFSASRRTINGIQRMSEHYVSQVVFRQ